MRALVRCSAVILACASLLTGCTTTESAYARAQRLDSLAAYHAYLKENPSGPKADAARARVAELEDAAVFRTVEQENTPEAYRKFAARQPASKYARDATQRATATDEEALGWTVRVGTKAAYAGFAAGYPQSPYLPEIQDRLRWMETARIGFAVEGVSAQDLRAAFGPNGPDPRLVLLPYGAPVEGTGVSVVIETRLARSESKGPLFSSPPRIDANPVLAAMQVGLLLIGGNICMYTFPVCAPTVLMLTKAEMVTTVAENWEATIRLGDLGRGVEYTRRVSLNTMTDALMEGRYAAYVDEADFIVWLVNRPTLPTGLARAAGRHGDQYLRETVMRSVGLRRCAPTGERPVGPDATAPCASGASGAFEVLTVGLRDDESWGVLTAAATALGAVGDRRAVPPLVDTLKDPIAYSRGAAAAALGELGDRAAIEPLISAMKDDFSLVQESAAKALTKLTGENLGTDQAKWQAWWEQSKGKVP